MTDGRGKCRRRRCWRGRADHIVDVRRWVLLVGVRHRAGGVGRGVGRGHQFPKGDRRYLIEAWPADLGGRHRTGGVGLGRQSPNGHRRHLHPAALGRAVTAQLLDHVERRAVGDGAGKPAGIAAGRQQIVEQPNHRLGARLRRRAREHHVAATREQARLGRHRRRLSALDGPGSDDGLVNDGQRFAPTDADAEFQHARERDAG